MPLIEKMNNQNNSQTERRPDPVDVNSNDNKHVVDIEQADYKAEMQNEDKVNANSSDEETEYAKNLEDYMLARDRERRVIVPPKKYGEADVIHMALSIAEQLEYAEPKNYYEAISCPEREHWIKAMVEELESLARNHT